MTQKKLPKNNYSYQKHLEAEVEKRTKDLIKSEKKFRAFTELAPVAIIIFQDNKWVYANPAAEQMTGYNLDELSSMGFLDFIHPEYRKLLSSKRDTKKHADLTGNRYELKIQTKNDSELWVDFQTQVIEYEEKDAIFVTAMNITDQKETETEKERLETQLRQAHKMESIGTLAGGIAHDFNNILSSVIGYTELTLTDLPHNSMAKNNLEGVLKAGRRAKDLVSQILTFSRQSEQVHVPVQIHLIVKEALKLLRSSLPTTIDMRLNIHNTGHVLADPTQIHQVIINLCTNAFHAMQDETGVLDITLSPIEINTSNPLKYPDLPPGRYVKLQVSDSGHGMSKPVIHRIFDPYFTTKEKGKGTGLGLAVVHGIVKSHKGSITVNSEIGKGSVFSVYLPVVDQAVLQKKPRERPLLKGKENILLVDDEQEIVEIEKQMLEYLGYTVTACAGSEKALETFQNCSKAFDMVITDMTMPNMTGDKLAKEIIKIQPDIPVILCTGFNEQVDKKKAENLGIKGFIMKPLSIKDISFAIRDVLDE